MRVVVVCAALVGVGCGNGDCEDFAGCPRVDADAGPDDFKVTLASAGLFVLSAGTPLESVHLQRGGELVFSTEPRDCDFLSEQCTVTVKRLELRLGDLVFGLSDGTALNAKNVVLRLVGPVETEAKSATDHALPASEFQTCLSVDGQRDHGVASAVSTTLHVSRYPSEQLSVDFVSTELVMHANDDVCSELRVPFTGSPWATTLPWQVPAP
jgi:hypothetical protein